MKIAIASHENHLKSIINPHFGRSDWFLLYDTVKDEYEFIENPKRYNKEVAGCDAADMLIEQGIKIAVAGRFGSKVTDLFRSKQVQMIIPKQEEILENFVRKFKKA
ncbi:MAG: NifB/NifX family molybdenum-iron cluster-binding protein [Lacibacter sp.]